MDEKVLVESIKAEIDEDARVQIDRAIEFMQHQPSPNPESALDDVYA